ncbi:hypothetical protein [Mycolicibacterium sp. lyk4-40-TYG-92]|uniref:hypothetical protein n=1 Tax=Mycolicibacterium sp. lyk4-40-TYG-92 TaxID=3040295 RepID=UPI00254E6B93|nr:hypothetical protein [Mycolicibacterium sp. lyk4-40-TYG-92]
MSEPRAISPADVLADDVNSATLNGTTVRKGSVAAFIANAKLFESLAPTDPSYSEVEAQLRELASALQAVGVLDVFTPRASAIAALIERD